MRVMTPLLGDIALYDSHWSRDRLVGSLRAGLVSWQPDGCAMVVVKNDERGRDVQTKINRSHKGSAS
jgi:hypothetical protein